jgi:dTDP-4-dehydrorhamnose 3,5-epimerase
MVVAATFAGVVVDGSKAPRVASSELWGPTMKFIETEVHGAWLVEPEPARDERGFFARTFCARSFASLGLETRFVQHSTSYSRRRGTLRGMHFQRPPHAEVKIVRCLRGAIFDVIVDLRPQSPSHGRWQGFELTAADHRQLYVPAGCAHGFQTLTDECEVGYLISAFHEPASAAGIGYDDPLLAITWPLPVTIISERDSAWPDAAR